MAPDGDPVNQGPARIGTGRLHAVLLPMLAGGLALSVPVGTAAQERDGLRLPNSERVESSVKAVPFGPGERMEYQVRLGPVSVGEGHLSIVGVEPVRGKASYHAVFAMQGGIPLARVNDRQESWFDIETLASRRFVQNLHQVRYRSHRHWEIYPEEMRWERLDEDGLDGEGVELPLDDIAFLYYVRTLPLEVGRTYRLENYFRKDRNPVLLNVLRREEIEVPAGTFQTLVVQPIIPEARGLFSEGGRAEVYFSDDERRLVVRVQSRIPVVGSVSLHLREYHPGRTLR